MDANESKAFEALPGAFDAVLLRRWDDLAKRPGWVPWSIDDVWPLINELIR